MPFYDYRCKSCGATFERNRSMAEADAPTICPDGHDEVVRLLPVFSAVRSSGGSAPAPTAATPRMGGGCGGACACH